MAFAPLLLCLITLLFPLFTSAQTAGNVSIGASITAVETSEPWRSPSGDFAFGFQQFPDNKDSFLLSIWFDKIPAKTLVWYERAVYPVRRGSTVQLDAAAGIVLRGPHGRVLRSSAGLSGQVAYGFMNDTGNFILRGQDSASLWESFSDPTDTILPTQAIQINGTLISRAAAGNFSQRRFYGRMNSDGNFVLSSKSVATNSLFDADYYTTGISNTNTSSSSGNQLVLDERGTLSISIKSSTLFVFSSSSNPPASENYYRATLDPDGIFALYYHPKNFSDNPGWITASSWPDNICISLAGFVGSGACGYNSVCSMKDGRPICQCPRGFSLADPSNTYSDCRANYVQSCIQGGQQGPPGDEYDLFDIADTDWPFNDYEQIQPSTLDQCRSLCLTDCFCGAAIYRNSSCWKKRLPLSNGKVDTTIGATAFLKFKKGSDSLSNPDTPPGMRKHKYRTLARVVSVFLGCSVFANFLLIGAGCLGYFRVYRKNFQGVNPMQERSNLHCFTHKELVQATNAFKEELGRGSFGIVYKGVVVMPNGSKSVVAVKKLDRVAQDFEKEFRTEVNVIGQIHHKNLVRLLGFCDEGPHRVLVYEYMSNGTLANLLFSDLKSSWKQRTQFALGIARGLTYLHEECSTKIIHCDIKPQNILLDEYYNVKISDFGLAKILKMNQSKSVTSIRGTKGYLAPEWYRNTPVTVSVDVYSFGVLLLEIVTCRRNLDREIEFEDGENPILTEWVWDCFVERRMDRVVENDEGALADIETAKRFVMVGFWCIQEDASMRPTMRMACQMLEGIVKVEMPPCPYSNSCYTR